ncbi:MAG: YrbL family protein [Hyphomicrobiales bacterium]|nr:YrbL family protein [Hyphomicrobiales bacterium]
MTPFRPFLVGQEIDLAQCALLRSGQTRNVHEHSALPGLLIKTLQPGLVDDAGYFKAYPWWKKSRPPGAYFAFLRELEEFVVLSRRQWGRDLPGLLPVARINGLVQTSAGLGLVVERISDPRGGLAPTMMELVLRGELLPRHVLAMDRFLKRCSQLHIVFGDMTANNIVYSESRDPAGEFVAVDGFGEKASVPVHRWSKAINDRKIARVRGRMLSMVPHELRPSGEMAGVERVA